MLHTIRRVLHAVPGLHAVVDDSHRHGEPDAVSLNAAASSGSCCCWRRVVRRSLTPPHGSQQNHSSLKENKAHERPWLVLLGFGDAHAAAHLRSKVASDEIKGKDVGVAVV